MDNKENKEEMDNSELVPYEYELYDFFINEYNDLFENILNLKGKNIYAIMKRNVFLLLGKDQFNKYPKSSMKKVYNKIKEEYFEPDNIVIKNLEENLNSIKKGDIPILNIDTIFAHCQKCYECTHICGEPLYNYKYYDLIICLKCKMIYKKNMIRLLCKSCNEEYFSYIVSENNYKNDFFPATWEKYHCFTYNYEQMPCQECLSPLYYSEIKKILKCFKCNWTSAPSNVKWICEICGNDFTSEIKEFVKFETKPEINCIKYAIINRMHARPFKCKCCGINPLNTNFFHVGCGGTYFISYLQKKIVIVCNKCKVIQNPDKIKWGCSNCKGNFYCDKIIILEKNINNNKLRKSLQIRTNLFRKDNSPNQKIKNSIKKEIKRISSNDRCLASKQSRRLKDSDDLKDIKITKSIAKPGTNKKNELKEKINKDNKNNEINISKKDLDKRMNTIETSGNVIDSNLFNKAKKLNLKRKEEYFSSNNSIECYVLEKNSTLEKLDEAKKEKKVIIKEETDIKKENNEKINEKIINIKKEKEIEKQGINEEKGQSYKKTGEEQKNKNKNKEKDLEKEKKFEKDKINLGEKRKIKEKENEKIVLRNEKNEENKRKIVNNNIKEIIEIKRNSSSKEEQHYSKQNNNNEIKNNRRKNIIHIGYDKTNVKGQSQKKTKNIHLNVNLNININNIMDNKQNNNNFHSIKHINSLKTTLPEKESLNIEPDEHFNPDEFKILEKIGFGSFGKIYNVKWIRNNKNYAMKIINLKHIEDIEDTQKKLKIIHDFMKKTECPGIIKTYGSLYEKIGIEGFKYYILMELAQTDWEKEIKYRSKRNLYYSEDDIFSMIQQLIKCYALLQKNNICHRDVKPQNILLLNGMYKICDFGEARNISGKNGYIHQPIRGSELYMSPILFDALNNHRQDVIHNSYKSDVFSLAMCLFLAATLSFDSLYEIREENNMENIKKILEKYLIPHYSNYLVNILYQMLQVDEEMRPNFIELEKIIFD